MDGGFLGSLGYVQIINKKKVQAEALERLTFCRVMKLAKLRSSGKLS